MNRIEQLIPDLNNKTNDQEEMMLEIMGVLNDTVTPIPEAGKFYTFVYNAKTPRITYDPVSYTHLTLPTILRV